ncbi:class I SAM-dependent methyltransferase [Oryzobacter telluris]|uniref:class I SAM-dependent methyltransferase n=1 Tax=Oryzobacter telluris TaxID=3149179 RepID=UPI00370DD933
MSDHDHYFTASPASADERRRVRVRLAGREVEVEVAGGIFSPGGLDKGTAVLFDEAPAPPTSGTFLDLGCGWGPLALTLGLQAPGATVWAVDVNERALDLTRRNAESLGLSGVHAGVAADVPADARFDLIWSNPPIRVGKAVLHELLRTWLPRLAPGGVAYLVVQKNLGSDSLQTWITTELGLPCARHASAKGFRVLRVSAAD